MNTEEFLKSKNFKTGMMILVSVIILVVVFCVGVFAGLEKARFSYRFSENYYRNFTGRPGPGPLMPMGMDAEYMNPHGTDGSIIKIDGDTILIKEDEGSEKTIVVRTDTSIKNGQSDVKLSELKSNDNIVVLGSPDSSGQMQAKLIRVVPNPLQ